MKHASVKTVIATIAAIYLLAMLHNNTKAAGDDVLYPLFLKPARHSPWQYGGHH